VLAGLLSTLTMPLAVGATRYSGSYDLLHSAFAIPIGLLLGMAAVVLARSARRRERASVGGTGAGGRARAGLVLGLIGLWVAGAALVAVSVYGLLEYAATRD
jgi:hypothetical protein